MPSGCPKSRAGPDAHCPPVAAAAAKTSSPNTRTPIKHLIVVIGENRGFDNVFATYVPADPRQSVWNLLSQGIVDKTGAPGLNAAMALQQQATDPGTSTGEGTYQLAPTKTVPFSTLPQPSTTLNGFPISPCALSKISLLNPAGISWCDDPGLLPADQSLLSTGGTGQKFYFLKNEAVLLELALIQDAMGVRLGSDQSTRH